MPRTHDLWQVIKVTSGTLRNTKRTEQSVLVTSQVCVCVCVSVCVWNFSKEANLYLILLFYKDFMYFTMLDLVFGILVFWHFYFMIF